MIRSEKRIKVQIWDTAGQERYQSITTAYYHGANGFIVMFDLTNDESFIACRDWIHQIRDLSLEDAVIVLVGNKLDLTEQRVVTNEQALELASTNNCLLYTSPSPRDRTRSRMPSSA